MTAAEARTTNDAKAANKMNPHTEGGRGRKRLQLLLKIRGLLKCVKLYKEYFCSKFEFLISCGTFMLGWAR